jgi:hypothetical protein
MRSAPFDRFGVPCAQGIPLRFIPAAYPTYILPAAVLLYNAFYGVGKQRCGAILEAGSKRPIFLGCILMCLSVPIPV